MGRLNNVAGFLLLCISCPLHEAFTNEIAFTDQTHLKPFKLKGTKGKHTVQLDFKTIHSNGVLLYKPGSAERASYLLLELVHGTVRCSGKATKKFEASDSTHRFDDNKWYHVKVTIGEEFVLEVNGSENSDLVEGAEEYIKDLTETNPDVYVGSAPHPITGRRNFTGCMRNVRIFTDSDWPFNNSVESRKCCCGEFSPIRFASSWSFLKLNVTNLPQYPHFFSAHFKIRTFYRHGVIFSVATSSSKFRLTLNESVLWFKEVPADSKDTPVKLGSQLGDGEWHNVHVSLNGTSKTLTVALDGKSKSKLNYYSLEGSFLEAQQLHISLGKDGDQQGFAGCLLDLRVNNVSYQERIKSHNTNSNDTQHGACELRNPCYPNPCKNGGDCSVKGGNFTCTCATNYEGLECRDKTIKTTCHMYMEQGLKSNASCRLGSDRQYAYMAECRIEGGNTMYTVVKLQIAMQAVQVGAGNRRGAPVKKSKDNVEYIVHKIHYKPEEEELRHLKEDSTQCEQTLSFTAVCSNVSFANKRIFSNDGKKEIKIFSDPQTKPMQIADGCTIRTSSLAISEKSELPVTSLWFDTVYSSIYFTVGPLRCFGKSNSNDEFLKDEKGLAALCAVSKPPTPLPKLTTTGSTVNHTPSDPPDGCNDSIKLCITEYPAATVGSSQSAPTNPEAEPDKWTDSSTNDELATALLSCLLVAVFLVTIKFGLPRCIVCVQTHSRSGEYIVASTEGTFHKRFDLINGRRIIQEPGKKPEGKGTPRDTPYWV